MGSRVRVLALVTTALLAGAAHPDSHTGDAAGAAPPARPFDLQLAARIPMRDGVLLAATIYQPAAASGRWPVVMTLTPYTADRYEDVGRYFAQNGYVFAAVDSRGRGDSDGEFDPWIHEGADGADAVRWLSRQPFCDGRVVTWGGSYSGKNQWALAAASPQGLAAIAPASAGYVGYDMGMLRNIPFPFMQRWLTYITGRTLRSAIYNDDEYWLGAYRDLGAGDIAYRDFDVLSGNPSSIWRKWIAHPEPDAYWASGNPPADQLAAIDVPVLSLTGAYDDAQLGTFRYWTEHRRGARRDDRDYLVLGPWDHAGSRNPQRRLGGLTFGDASLVDTKALHRQWYDWILKSGPRPALLSDHVVYYLAGADEWQSASSIDAASAPQRTLYLTSTDSQANSASRPGGLLEQTPAADVDAFVYDPGRPPHNEGFEGGTSVAADYLTTDRLIRRIDGDGLVYDTSPFSTAVDFVGRPLVTLSMRMNVPDTDFRVAVFAVEPGDRPIYLTQDYLRARYRKSETHPELVPIGTWQTYRFDRFYFNARRLPPGSIVRLVIVPLGAGLHNQRNRNSGGAVAAETAKDNRIASIDVQLGGGSLIQLPLRAVAAPTAANGRVGR